MKLVNLPKVAILLSFTISISLQHSSAYLQKIILAQSRQLVAEAEDRIGLVPGVRSVIKTIERQPDRYKKGHLYELLVALDDKAKGFEIIALNKRMSAAGKTREFDVIVRNNGAERWIECKACQWDRIPAMGYKKLYKQFEDQVEISKASQVAYQMQSYYPLNQGWADWFISRNIFFLVHDCKRTTPYFILP